MQRVQGPAIGLIVTGGLGLLMSLVSFVMNLAGVGMSGLSGDELGAAANMFAGGLGLAMAMFGFLASAFVGWCGLQMKELKNRTLVTVGSVLAMIPCLSPCCLIGLPIGIWALIVMNDPAVKGSFRS